MKQQFMGMDTKQKILISFCILTLFSMLLFILFSDKGLSDLFKLKSERDRLMSQNVQLKKKTTHCIGPLNDCGTIRNISKVLPEKSWA